MALQVSLSSTLLRHYPAQPICEQQRQLNLHAARGERISYQVVMRDDERANTVSASVATAGPLAVTIRRVGYVPLPHFNTDTPLEELDGVGYLPGYVPDPLFPESHVVLGPYETHAFWVTMQVPIDTPPGVHPVHLTLSPEHGESITVAVDVIVHAAVLPPRKNFPVTHWFYADALLDWYKFPGFTEPFWQMLDAYFADLAS
ncbi:MAG TPA: hypothetical protein VHV83_16525, partial [Armatimonadota bacterium]|nr:hypothetical protein [Armatimonadota bacterium]